MVVSVTYHNHSYSFKNMYFILLNMFKATVNEKKYIFPFPREKLPKLKGPFFPLQACNKTQALPEK